eukprot:scaffold25098_cov64-Cyclotella_meneghiniana.AAC.1
MQKQHQMPSASSTNQQWNGEIWIDDNWTEEEKNRALAHLKLNKTPQEQIHQQKSLRQFHRNSTTNWNAFYEQNQNKFFKDRHYLHKAFPLEFGWLYHHRDPLDANDNEDICRNNYEEEDDDDAADNVNGSSDENYSTKTLQSLQHWSQQNEVHIVEIGCGVGNAILPMLEQHSRLKSSPNGDDDNDGSKDAALLPELHIHCLDFAPNAIRILKNDSRFRAALEEGRATAHVYDLSSMHPSSIPIQIGHQYPQKTTLANSADVAILLFCISAIGPHPSPELTRAARHVMDMLKPGGILVIRDYGRFDEAQLKLHGKTNCNRNKELGNNFYRKGDGTGCYYFELNDLKELFGNNNDGSEADDDKLNVLELEYIQRVYRNRADGKTRRRVWVQGRFQKPLHGSTAVTNQSTHNFKPLLEEFYNTSISRWDMYYKTQGDSTLQNMSLNEALASKFSNNLLQIFPEEFGRWQALVSPKLARRQIPAADHQPENETSISSVTVIDVGCGIGNGTLLNIMAIQQMKMGYGESKSDCEPEKSLPKCPNLRVHFVDASREAVTRLISDPRYNYVESGHGDCTTTSHHVLDISTPEFPAASKELPSSADIALLVFTLSSLGPYQHPHTHPTSKLQYALRNIASALKPGGVVLFRDFGRYDDDQLQLSSSYGSQICDNFYFRDDDTGTAVYFFDLEEVRELFTTAGFEVIQLEYITRPYSKTGKHATNLTVNGGAVKRTRIWIHGRFRKFGISL